MSHSRPRQPGCTMLSRPQGTTLEDTQQGWHSPGWYPVGMVKPWEMQDELQS